MKNKENAITGILMRHVPKWDNIQIIHGPYPMPMYDTDADLLYCKDVLMWIPLTVGVPPQNNWGPIRFQNSSV